MSKQSYAMEDFLDHSYGTVRLSLSPPPLARLSTDEPEQMFESERTRIIRNAPALAPVPERQPIGDSFFPAVREAVVGVEGEEGDEGDALRAVDLVSALWTF